MKRRVVFRSFVILLAAVMLLSSTSAYNILVYANQDSVANSLSAIGSTSEETVTEPNIAVQGGSLELNADETTTETTTVVWQGNGSSQNPYQISSAAHLMQVNKMVNATVANAETGIADAENKHFILTADIDLTSLFANGGAPYIASAGSAYLVSADPSDPASTMKYINLDGSYVVEGVTYKHKIYVDGSVTVDNKNYENFAIFGYLSNNSVISNVIFENIDVNVTALQPQRISVIAYRNDGIIRDCEIIDSSITLPATSQIDGAGTGDAYYGIAGAVADNRATVSNVNVKNFTLSLSSNSANDYIGGLVGQNRGTVEKSAVSGLKMTVNNINHYVGGLVGYNAATVTDCAVNMPGDDGVTNNIFGGGYVGGLVGYNDSEARISNSSVTGSITSAQSPTSVNYNMYGTAENANSSVAYFGGITGVNSGTVEKTTVSDLGFYMGFTTVSCTGYFGGIAAVSTGGLINTSVASGSFVAQNATVCRAGGIIGCAQSDDTNIVNDCYALFSLKIPSVDLVGAIVGYGGNTQTATNSYWSDAISGCITSYVIKGDNSEGVQRPDVIETSLGKLNSANRAVTVAKNAPKTVYASELIHTFEKIHSSTYNVANVTVANDISLVGTGTNNTISALEYRANLTFPTDASGNAYIGSDDKQGMAVSFSLDVFVTSATGDPDNQDSPLVISASTMAKFIFQAPYGHYRLSTDIAVLDNSWNSVYFTGSIDGNDHFVSTDTNIFRGIIGSRTGAPEVIDKATSPDSDNSSNTKYGLIKNLTVELSENISTAVFGTVYNSSIINVALTDGDPTPDDGNEASYEGYIANITTDYTAAFINYAVGYSYIYGCSTDVSVKMGQVNYSAAFIAHIGTSVVIDNCLVNSVGAYIGENNSTSKAVFLGHTKDNQYGLVINSVVTARVIGSGTCYIVMGPNLSQWSETYSNITWSKMQYESNEIDSNMNSAEVKLWGSEDKDYSSIEQTEPAGTPNSIYKIQIPQKVSAFENASISDFSISLITIDETDNYAESPATDSTFTLTNTAVENGEIVINVSVSENANEGESAWVKVFHYDTGLLTYVRYTVIKEAFELGDDGYYHISTPADLIAFSEATNSSDSRYLSYAYKLDKSIDMSGYTFTPAAAGSAFQGRFDGMGYTIKNLTISVDTTVQGATSNVAFISSAVSDNLITVTNKETGTAVTETVESGIYNIKFENADITATGANANAAVVLANSASSSSTEYSKVNISNIEIIDSKVVSQGKNTAAVLALSLNTHVNVNGIKLTNVSVQTGYAEEEASIKYINDTSVAMVGGLGGVIGTAHDTVVQPSESRLVAVNDVTINGLKLTGIVENEDAYAMVNAGSVIGVYQKCWAVTDASVHKLSIGNVDSENEYDVVINDVLIMSTGITGGVIGSTNAQTVVNKVKISSTDDNRSQIFSTTQYFIGGIAGHIGSFNKDNLVEGSVVNTFAVSNMYGTISDCLVENTEIKATNESISSESNQLGRNVAVGGIVGAINGPAAGETVKNCMVKNSLVEGVVVGGIVGSNIERNVISGNRIAIDSCEIINSDITTPDKCYAVEVTYDANLTASFGVGGIIGTNRYSKISYAQNVSVTKCTVDSGTKITNYTDYESAHVYVATGGIMGFATSFYSDFAIDGACILLSMNEVYAEIITTADMGVDSYFDILEYGYTTIRTGTGGVLGMFGSITQTGGSDTNIAYIRSLSISNSCFDGSLLSADCIGGVIGAVINTVSNFFDYDTGESIKDEESYIPDTPILEEIVVSGQFDTFASTNLIRGGVAIGHIIYVSELGPVFGSDYAPETIQLWSDDTADGFFSQIYYSSLEIDNSVFPFLGYLGLSWADAELASDDDYYEYYFFPVSASAITQQRSCYIDVNKKADNTTYQIAAPENVISNAASSFTIGSEYAAPVATRGELFSFDGTTYWKSSNSSVVAVSDSAPYNNVLVSPKSTSTNPVTVSIDYRGTLTSPSDSSWSVPVSLPVGFRIYSSATKALDYVVTDSGTMYYLISEPIDFNYIESGKNYWLKNDIVFDAELFETNGTFDGGYYNSKIFTGEFASPPEGTYEINGNSDNTFYTNGAPKTITGIKIKPVTIGSYTASALFAQADGAIFKNFNLVDVSSTGSADYAASVAAVVNGSLTAENITVQNVNISGAKYSGGLFGGMFNAAEVEVPWRVSNCQVEGTRTGEASGYVYSSNISGINGAAGIAVHTDQNAASFTDVRVSGCSVSQCAETMDSTYFDYGAAGISLAFSGEISSNSNSDELYTIENCCISGEVASGAVVRTYSSTQAASFTSHNMLNSTVKAEYLTISSVNIKDTQIKGTHSNAASQLLNKLVSSGGILARVACAGVEHIITDCTLDKNTTVEAPVGAGGIIGCYEEVTSLSDTDANPMLVTVDGCRVQATVRITNGVTITNTNIYANMGVGGIIGSFSRNVGFTGTTISNCVVNGTISGSSAVGGIVGAIWSQLASSSTAVTSMHFENMTSNFVENCVVSAEFENASGNEAFAYSNPTTGLIVGHVFDAAYNSYIFDATDKTKYNSNNYPFYNIYYSGYKYPENATYLFGVIKPGTNTSQKSLNYSSTYPYYCYTDYVYDMDFYTQNPAVIDSTDHYLVLPDEYRVQQTLSEEDGIWVIDNLMFNGAQEIKLSDFTFKADPKVGETSALTYRFDADASLAQFTLSDSANTADSSVAVLENVTTTSPLISVEKVSEGTYSLSKVSEPTETFVFDMVFVYSNGLELVAPFRVEVSEGDYYFAETESGTNYFVFNAANLRSTMQLTIGAGDNVIQCFDVFATLDNTALEDTVNAYTSSTTLAQAYDGVTFNGEDILTLLRAAKHRNPEFDQNQVESETNPLYISIEDYLGLEDNETLDSVTLRRIVKEINTVSYDRKDDDKFVSALYNNDFSGNYTVLKSVTADKSTGLTQAGEYYSIYGLEIHAVNINPQKSDAAYTGMFKSLVGATVTGLTFVNPRIEVVGAKADENYAGVLAGTASGAKIVNVSVERFAAGDKAYVSSIRWMTDASTYVGGIVGMADAATTIENANVSGIDVVGASLAGSSSGELKTVMAGGVAGASDATVTNATVADSRILIERNDRYRNYYLSYAGGIAARATGNVSGATVSNTLMRDCTCEVIAQDEEYLYPYSTYSCEDSALVADRIGGIAAFTNGTLNVSAANIKGVTIRAFDLAGGILAEVENNAEAAVSVTNSSVVADSDIRVYSSANVASASSRRQYFNAAGGAIGKIDNLSSLNVDTFNFEGYVGTYSYDNLNKDCTAGGIIGFVTDKLTSLDAIRIYNSTVSGEVSGYRTTKTGNIEPYLGAAGGIIGKINTIAVKSTTEKMVSDCVMGAEVNLYNNVSGTSVNANPVNPADVSTNVGKILGTLVSQVVDEETNESVSSNFAIEISQEGEISNYFDSIYVSSYPQDIVAYGSKDFYGSQDFSAYTTYTDINKVINETTGESTGALAVGGLDLSGIDSPAYTDDEYSELAIIPIDTSDPSVVGTATRGFRLVYSSIGFGEDNSIVFEGTASIVAETDIGQAYAEVSTGAALADKGDGYYYGTLHIDQVKNDIIGDIVMDYSYGLQVNVQFIGMDIKGTGSSTDPFKVSEPKHFAVVRVLRDKNYIQTNDIDFASQYSYSETVLSPLWATVEGFEPIGTANAPFIGSYDGQGNLITNLYIARAESENVGLFGVLKEATVSNVHIELAGEMPLSLNSDDLSDVTVVQGNVTGKNKVGGLAGSAVNSTVTNCSVVKGSVIGETAVGGLVGSTTESDFVSCFTSTTAFAHAELNYVSSAAKTAGGIIGTANGSLNMTKCFALGYTALDTYNNTYGSVGGFVGYASDGASIVIDNAFVGSSLSESYGNGSQVFYFGLTVGAAGSNATVAANNVFVSAATASGEGVNVVDKTVNNIVNPILGTASGATLGDNVKFDSGLNGTLPNRTEVSAAWADFSLSGIDIGVTDDSYTAAYVDFASVEIRVADVEKTDRMSSYTKADQTAGEYQLGGLFYPVTVVGTGLTVTSSEIDDADKSDYPEEMDTELYGNGDSKNTDFLFRDTENGTTVYTNIFVFSSLKGAYNDGKVYDNGELFYNNSQPYFTVEKAVDKYDLYRKVTYPIQTKYEDGGRVYPIATERQLNALAGYESSGTFATFSTDVNYALIENITLGNYEFKPITNFTGVLNGKGHTVSNVTINQPESTTPVGFFSELTKGAVKNLHLEVGSVVGNDYVGGLVGYIGANGTDPSAVVISNCSVSSYSEASGVEGNEYVGGLVGYAVAGESAGINSETGLEEGKAGFFNSFTDVTVSGRNVVGGLVGCSEMYITNCYSTGDVNGAINSTGDSPRGIGGLVGVLAAKSITAAYPVQTDRSKCQALLNSSFSSSAVDVSSVTGYNARGNGVGGLVGNVTEGTSIATVFSSGSVRFCYDDNATPPACGNVPALGVGGLVGVLNSKTTEVYSAASVAAKVGDLTAPEYNESGQKVSGSVVGIGGVVGVSNSNLQSAYSSGSTIGETTTSAQEIAENNHYYGVGGVIGLVSGDGLESSNLYFDHNASAVSDDAVGKVTSGELTAPLSIGSKSTKAFTQVPESERVDGGFLGGNFKFTTGAYPYLSNFFADTVSLVIRFNALLSIVAVEIDERDQSAVDGDGISMAMNIPTGVPHDGVVYTYGFEADNSLGNSATSIVDTATNTLSVQRTSNTKEQANFIITISKVDGETTDGNVVYSEVASRPFSRVTAEMLGTQAKPYLIASQTDLEHVAMSSEELSNADGLYAQWNTPIDSNGTEVTGKVHYRLMGYVNLNESAEAPYDRSFSTLTGGYSLDGNGYSIRNLTTALATTLDANSSISNVTFENVEFESESLIGTLDGSVTGVNVYGKASGSNVAGIAATVGESAYDDDGNVISGLIEGCVVDVDYVGNGAAGVAGLALDNNGTINMSASVGNISGEDLSDVSALVGTNAGTIKNSFTMGDVFLDNPSGVVAGFVGTNSGTVENCYTRCNFKVTNVGDALTIGSFAGNNSGTIGASFAAGLFDVRNTDSAPAALSSIFAASNSGTLKDVMFDKQLSGTCFKDIFTYAESTSDIITMSNHNALCSADGYTRATEADGETYKSDEYPQLSVILATASSEDEVTVRMYRALRSYSQLSATTAVVANDNYIDNIAAGSNTTMLTHGMMSWVINGTVASTSIIDDHRVLVANAWDDIKDLEDKSAIATATLAIEDFYNVGAYAKLSDTINLYFTVDDDGVNPNFAGGNGTKESPYTISEPAHVIALSYYGKNASGYFKVINDIAMSGASWNGSYINIFKANLDGQGFVISDVEIPETGANAFIGSLEGGSISNLGLTGIKVTTGTNSASALLAAKALNNATVTNCVVIGELVAPTGSNAGGIFGESDGSTVIDGCIVSGKIDSGATNVGGFIGLSSGTAIVSNSLSTALVKGSDIADTATGGVIGSGGAEVINTVVAGNVKGAVTGNIAGDGTNVTVTNSYYDKQLSTVDGGATASTTHFLTNPTADGAFATKKVEVTDGNGDLGTSVVTAMTWISGFAGYPVPAALALAMGDMLNAVKLASAKITFATGIGAGTSTTFTTATPTVITGAEPGVSISEAAATFLVADKTNMRWSTDTSLMTLSEVYNGELTYTLGTMTRYVDVTVGKKVNTVNYKIEDLASGNSILSAITGNGGSATAATAFDSAQQGVLCSNMVFTYDIVDGSAQLFRVETQLPNGYVQGEVTAVFNDTDKTTVTVNTDENGTAYIAVPTSIGVFDTIDITVTAVSVDTWGVRSLFGLFR